MRNCDDCKVCCQGYLTSNVQGFEFGNMIPCSYMKEYCTIYDDRPSICKNYYCAWAQELLPEWMRPDKIEAVVSVENGIDRQFLKAVSKNNLDPVVEEELNRFVQNNNTYLVKTRVIPIRQL